MYTCIMQLINNGGYCIAAGGGKHRYCTYHLCTKYVVNKYVYSLLHQQEALLHRMWHMYL